MQAHSALNLNRCECTAPLYSFCLCAECKKIIYERSAGDRPKSNRKRAIDLGTQLVRAMNDYQTLLGCFDANDPLSFIPLKQQFSQMIQRMVNQSFDFEDEAIERAAKEQRDKCKKKEIISEVLNTEKAYNSDLQLLLKYYIPPLLKTSINRDDIITMKNTLETMLLQSKHIIAIMQMTNTELLFKEMCSCVDDFSIYSDYFIPYNKHIKALQFICNQPEFVTIRKSVSELRQLSLSDFMVKPLQRLTKYPLFLKELKPLLTNEEQQWMSVIETRMHDILEKQNIKQRKYLSDVMVKELEPRLYWKKYGKQYNLQGESILLLENEHIQVVVSNVRDTKRYDALYTFSDFIIIGSSTKSNRIAVEDILLLCNCHLQEADHGTELQLTYVGDGRDMEIKVTFNTPSERALWVSKFKEIPHAKLTALPLTQVMKRASNTPDVLEFFRSLSPSHSKSPRPLRHQKSMSTLPTLPKKDIL